MTAVCLPEHIRRLAPGETFRFRCHPGVPCFTDCCRELDLALTPYDVLRLRQSLGLSSADFFARYALVEQQEGDAFPHVYLGMIDDGRASCPFVSPEGCRVYPDRPGACRTYPLGRAAYLAPDGRQQHFHVLLTEPHCKGFTGAEPLTSEEWVADQDLQPYNMLNDATMAIYQHRRIKDGKRLTPEQADMFLLALYRLDEFRAVVMAPRFQPRAPLSDAERLQLAGDDTALLRFGIRWLESVLFDR